LPNLINLTPLDLSKEALLSNKMKTPLTEDLTKSQFQENFNHASDHEASSYTQVDENTYRLEEEKKPLPISLAVLMSGLYFQNISPISFKKAPEDVLSNTLKIAVTHMDKLPDYQKVRFQVDGALNMEISIEKSPGKLKITLFLSEDLQKDLKKQMPALAQRLETKLERGDIDLSFTDFPKSNQQGGSQQQRQKHSPEEEKSELFELDRELL